jgi:hypothetical protein
MVYGVESTDVSKVDPNFHLLRPLFGRAPADTITSTFAISAQFAHGRVCDTIKQHWHSRFPAFNVKRQKELTLCSVIHLRLIVV